MEPSTICGYPVDTISALAAVGTFLIALMAALFALRQIHVGKVEARRALAHSMYMDYLIRAKDNPSMSSPSLPKSSPAMLKWENDPTAYESYKYYVSAFLFASEEILDLIGNDPIWRSAIRKQMRHHALYLKRRNFEHYSSRLRSVVQEAIEEYDALI